MSSHGTALITGASGGIGLKLAKIMAADGWDLVLVARREELLNNIARELSSLHSVKIEVIATDLNNNNAAQHIFDMVSKLEITVDCLVNNAGFYVRGAFSETSWEMEQKLIQLQCLNHTQLAKLFLPAMLKQGKGGILNICSTGSKRTWR